MRQPCSASVVQGVEHLAPHVEWELADGGVADPHRSRPLIPAQPRQLMLGDATTTGLGNT